MGLARVTQISGDLAGVAVSAVCSPWWLSRGPRSRWPSLCSHSPMERPLGRLQFVAVMNKAAVNIRAQSGFV